MTGPLEHFMPVIAGSRRRPSNLDIYFNYVSILTEFNGLADGVNTVVSGNQNLVKDNSVNNVPLRIIGTPQRVPLDEFDEPYTVSRGVSNSAAYHFDATNSNGSGIMVMDNQYIELGNQDFKIEMDLRASAENSGHIAGRWKSVGNYSWLLSYSTVYDYLGFDISYDGNIVEPDDAWFDMRVTGHDGITAANFFNNQWHHIEIIRSAGTIRIWVDGFMGSNSIAVGTATIFDPAPTTAALVIGSVASDLVLPTVSSYAWDGFIDNFKMTIGSTVQLDVNFDTSHNVNDIPIYWGFWWVGNYPQSKPIESIPLSSKTFQDEKGLIKTSTYVGHGWSYDDSLNLLNEDFTIEVFGYSGVFKDTKTQTIVGMGWATYKCWRFAVKNTSGNGSPGELVFQYSTDGSTVTEVNVISGFSANQSLAYDLAAVRDGNILRIFVDGALAYSGSITGSLFDASTQNLRMRFYNGHSGGDAADSTSRIKAFRLTKGIARYRGSSYRIPILPLPKAAA